MSGFKPLLYKTVEDDLERAFQVDVAVVRMFYLKCVQRFKGALQLRSNFHGTSIYTGSRH